MIKQDVWAVTAEVDTDTHRVVSNGPNEMAHVFKNEEAAVAYRVEHSMVQEPFHTKACVVVDRETFVEMERKFLQYEACCTLANEHGMTSAGRPAAALRAVIDGAKLNEVYTSLLIEACVKHGYRGSTPGEMVVWLTRGFQPQYTKPEPVTIVTGNSKDPVEFAQEVSRALASTFDKDRRAAVNRITAEIDKHRQAGNHSLALEYEQLIASYLTR